MAGLVAGVALLAAAASAAAQTAEAPQARATVALLRAQDEAVLRVGERLVTGGAAFCGPSGRSAGMTVQLRGQYGPAFRAAAVAELGVGDLPTVTAVAADSAAAIAGLRVGDQIAAIDDHRFAPVTPRQSGGDFAPTAAALDVLEREWSDGAARLEVIRAGRPAIVTLNPRPACRARFDVRAGRSQNASSDGTYVQVSSDLVAETRDDQELAAVLAHELAHNVLRHPQRLKGSKPRTTVRATEIEADRLSVYLLDAAGYGTAGATAFWGRWGRRRDLGIFAARTHPGWKQRIALIASEASRIEGLRRAGQPVAAPPDLAPRD